ncbi:MAG: UDP-glucose--hexose-1-phosphate uridylyltransferase [Acidobacteria bacterium]|nr:UDP-glucose--hexose-1-phosphate uridylyltransferase [Acidobacteriota bacterium]
MADWAQHPHRRLNPLTREWILVSPHRTQRPWQGQVEREVQPTPIGYDPKCYLCPGNARSGGARNPAYTSTFVFENDFAALKADTPLFTHDESGLLVAAAEPGNCRVVCFSPRHDLTLALMPPAEIRPVVDVWVEQFLELGALPHIGYVQIFENRGDMMGCSNPHPHGQIWASRTLPTEIEKEDRAQSEYRRERGSCLLCDTLAIESAAGERIVCRNELFTALVPFWAVWPFEILLVSRLHRTGIDQFDGAGRDALAALLHEIAVRFDNLFECSFPYSMGFHQRPTDSGAHEAWHFHAHFYPPLLRSATVRKFMVGYEMLCQPQRDITPEAAAARLRELSDKRY